MSSYATTDDGTLIVCWWTGAGPAAQVIARCPSCDVALLRELADELTHLSEECWHIYTEPTPAIDPFGEQIDRRRDLQGLSAVIASPEAGHGDSFVISSYVPVVEYAQRASRVLHRIDDAQLSAAVRADVQVETDAVLAADLGNLKGRGGQAAQLSRVQASPVQVDAAWQALAADPLDTPQLLTDYDPAAASVAAAAWLLAAAQLAAEQAHCAGPPAVIQLADDIEAVPVRSLTSVLDLLGDDDPYSVVAHLITEAQTVATGRVPDIDLLEKAIEEARTLAAQLARDQGDVDALLADVPLCVLDPTRPAPDLLEDLLFGIHACWLVWDEHASHSEFDPARSIDEDSDLADDDVDDDPDELDDEPEAEHARRQKFCDALRSRMSHRRP